MQKVSEYAYRAGAWCKKNHAFIAWALVAALAYGTWFAGGREGPAPVPGPPPPILQAAPELEHTYSFGWIEDKEAADAFAATLAVPEFADTEAGRIVAADLTGSSYLWQPVQKLWATSKYNNGQPYPNVDQKSVGCCVGCAAKQTQDVLLANQVMLRTGPGEWRPYAVEPPYANSRIIYLQKRIRGDGSSGSAVASAVSINGNLGMEVQADGTDLSKFDPMRTRSWGNNGVPSSLVGECLKHKTDTVARIRTWTDCKKALDQGYPVLLASNQGFEGRKDRQGHLIRDQDGFLAAGGTWSHAMSLIGYRTSNREGGFILNSWGDAIIIGPLGDGGPPTAGFWADASVVNRMCQSGDCWVFSKTAGFPARKLPWKVDRRDPLRLLRPGVIALGDVRCEASLAF